MKEKLLALANKVEALVEPSRDIDMEIAVLLGVIPEEYEAATMHGMKQPYFWHKFDHRAPPYYFQAYTRSLASAMSIIPDTEYSMTNLYGVARAHVEMANDYGGHHGESLTNYMASAFCAASLRALAYMEDE